MARMFEIMSYVEGENVRVFRRRVRRAPVAGRELTRAPFFPDLRDPDPRDKYRMFTHGERGMGFATACAPP
jgi:hypothetical protein